MRRRKGGAVKHSGFVRAADRSMLLASEMEAKHPNLRVLKYRALEPLLVKIRDQTTGHAQFKHYSDRLMRCNSSPGLLSASSGAYTAIAY
jgi:hypothetical protein